MSEQANVERFINGSGYPLEYATTRHLQKAGFVTQQGRSYPADDVGLTVPNTPRFGRAGGAAAVVGERADELAALE